MRIAVVNESRLKTGGVESYLEQLIPALVARGNEVACLFESEADNPAAAIQIPQAVTAWTADDAKRADALAALQEWKPDLVFLHSPVDPDLKKRLLKMAPGVFFAHNYYGTCVSGMKRHAFPQVRPCGKVFSPACLAHYFPRRCGGLNPLTMLRRFHDESAWLAELRDFAAIVVASEHMAKEYCAHGFIDRIKLVGYPVRSRVEASTRRLNLEEGAALRLLFMGRMENYKGGITLLDALPEVAQTLGRQIQLAFAGDGRERSRWESHAEAIVRGHVGIEVKFAGWLSGAALDAAIDAAHLLVFPSTWPEPFGLVGLEAGAHGLPTAAFDVGGVGDWLKDGVNGHVAPGDPPTARGLAEAIYKCTSDVGHYVELSAGARGALANFTMDKHLDSLIRELQRACKAAAKR